MKRIHIYFILAALILTGCAEVSPHAQELVTDDSCGFFSGLWHGMILPFSWIGSLFSDEIAIYALDNNGGWYDFGFFLGAVFLGFGVGSRDN